MFREDIIKKRAVIFRIVFFSLIIFTWVMLLILFGIFSVMRTLFIVSYLGIGIVRGIIQIKREDYEESVLYEIFRTVKRLVAAAAVLMFTMYPFPSVIGTHPFQYGFSKMYTEKMWSSAGEFLPEKLPDKISEYRYEFFPGFMQGDPFIKLDFKTDYEEISRIEKYAEQRAAGVLDLDMYRNYNTNSQSGDIQVDEFKKAYFKNDENESSFNYFAPRTGRAGEEPGSGNMYIISSNGNRNHPVTYCITINYETGTVSFTA